MENTKNNTSSTAVIDDAGQTHAPSSLGVGTDPVDMGDLSNSPSSLSEPTPTQFVSEPESSRMKRFFKRTDVIVGAILLLSIGGVVLFSARSNSEQKALQTDISKEYKTVQVPLAGFVFNEDTVTFGSNKVVINGPLTLNEGVIISPSVQPNSPTAGQLYFDQNTNQLAYYNGTAFVPLTANGQVVQSLGGASGQVTVGGGLTIVGNQLSNAGVVSFGGQTGTITVGTGLRMIDNAIQNAGLLSLVAGTANLQIANDGNGNATISSVGGGSGTVTSPGGTVGQLALFNGAQDIGDSIVSQSGGAITVTGGLNVSGTVGFTNQLTVGNGGTGASSLAANGVLVGNGGSAISSVTTGTPGLCLVSTAGAPAFASCSGTLGVTSLNGLTGALTIANATGLGSTITISDATNSGIKGIASYNATNFSVATGLVNTVQNIDATATPTFAGVNTNSITPSSAFTVGAIGQSFTLRGGAASQITANSGGFSTAVGFQTPSANTTYRFTTTTGGSYDICTTFGNCTGTGNNVAGNGTQNRIVKFTTTGSVIGDSTISDTGGVVTTSSNFVVQGGVVTIGVPNTQNGSIAFAAGASAFSGTLAQGALTSARNYLLPDADGTVCLSSGNCLGGGGGGANTALSNLTSVAINTTLLPNAAGTINLGSAVLPFGELMIAGASGTPATNNFKITGVSTGGLRTITLPNASGTICLQASTSCGFATGSGAAFVQGGNGFGTTATLGTTDGNDLVIVRNGATQLTVGNGNVTLASNVDLLLQGVNSYISNPQGQAGSEAFGLNASVGNTDSLAVGNGSFAGINATAIGRSSNAQGNGVALGIGSYGDSGSTALGAGATTQNFDNSIALGRSSATTAQNQLVIGAAAPSYINSVVIGNGVAHSTPIGFTLQGTSGSGSNVAGANTSIAAGQGTGSAAGGNILFQTSAAGSSGSALNSLTTVGTFNASSLTLGNNIDLLMQGTTAYISNPQLQNHSEAFGLGAAVGDSDSLAVGYNAAAGIGGGVALGANSLVGNGSVAVGVGAIGTGWGNSVAVGSNTYAQDWSVAIGSFARIDSDGNTGNGSTAQFGVAVGFASTAGNGSTSIGYLATATNSESIAIGQAATTTGANQLVIGGDDGSGHGEITQAIIGNGATNAAPIGFTLQGTSGSGSNVAGASTTIAAGQGTGSALGGSILFKSSLAGGSGSSLNGQTTLATLSTTSLTTGTNIDILLQGPTAYISNTQGQSQSEAFGLNATVNSNNGVAVGYAASASNDDVAIGNNATANSYGVAIGGFSVASQAGAAVGQGASAGFNGAALGNGAGAGSWSVALGSGATTAGNTQIAIGYKAATTANHQLVIGGSTLNDSYIDTAYIGSGVTDVTPVNFTLQGTGGSGTNVAGASISIAGGAGTGSASGGNVAIKVATPGTSGSTANVPATVALFSGINGSALFHNSVNSTAGFQVQNAGGLALFSVDTSNNLLSILGPGTNGSNSKITFGNDGKLSITGGNGSDNNGLNIMAYARLFVTNTNGDSSVVIDTQNGKTTFSATPGQDANGGLLVTQANTNDVFFVGTAGSEGLVKIGYVGDNNATPLILDNDATSDPTTSNGAMYYNVSLNKFRCYENSTWKDCIGSASGAFVQGGNSFAAVANLGTNDNFDVNLRTNGTTRLTVKNDGSEIDLASNTDFILQGATAYISNSQASGGSEAFGLNATVNGTNRSVVVGNGANINDNDSVAIGYNATGSNGSVIIGSLSSCTNNFCVSIGNGAVASYSSVGVGGGVSVTHNEAVGIGSGAATDSFGATVIGSGASANHLQSIALGHNTHTTQDNQLVIGGPSASIDNITSVVIGSGVTDATPVGFVLQATSGTGTNISGASVTIAGGQSTGTGNGGNIAFQISNPGSSGSSLNSLATVVTFSGVNGSAVFQNTTNSNTAFQVQNSTASPFLTVDTTGSGTVTVGAADTVGTLFVLDTKTDYTNHANSNSEPTGVAGGMYYNSSIGQFRCYEVDYWRDCMVSARTSYDYTADMDNPDPDHQIDFSSGSGGGFGTTPGATGHPGIVQQGTGTSSSSAYAYIGSTSNNNDTILLGNGDYWRYETVMRIPTGGTLSNGTNRYTVVTGFTDNAGDAVDGCYFRYSDNINGGKWQGVCRSNSTESVCDTGTTVALNSWYRLTVTVNAAGNSTNFQINGTSLCQITTNIATGAGRQTAWASVINKSVGTADRFVEVDYVTLQGQLGTAR